jgi:OmpA-OmpF porin, OOP family
MRLKATIATIILLAQSLLSAQNLNSNPSLELTNSGYDELNPVIAPDGKTLYMTIANHPQNTGGLKDPGDIWYAVLKDDRQWSEPIHGGALLNDRAYNGVAGFSSDGSEMFLLSHYGTAGNLPRSQGISVSRGAANSWNKPENISIPYFQNKAGALYGYLPPDKSFFVFSAETYGTRGVEDLYISLKAADGKWMEPRNLGAKINTQFQELCPSVSPDGKTLYFSSNGRKGSGSFDVYSSTRLDDTWTSWSDPENMGASVNTEGRDLFYRVYADGFSVFTSTQNSDGYGDIRIFRTKDPIITDSTVVVDNSPAITPQVVESAPMAVSDNSLQVHGTVSNSKTAQNIPAKITFEKVENGAVTTLDPIVTNVNNGYSTTLKTSESYRIKIEAEGYISTIENLDLKTYELNDLEMNFKLQPIEVGTTVNLKNVLFEQSKTNLLSGSYEELDLVVSFLKANPNVKIELAGHTDNRGVFAQNIKLSQSRVDVVKEYLVSKGIDAKRITGKGYGGTTPIASNDSEETRKLNRRVEFIIKKF